MTTTRRETEGGNGSAGDIWILLTMFVRASLYLAISMVRLAQRGVNELEEEPSLQRVVRESIGSGPVHEPPPRYEGTSSTPSGSPISVPQINLDPGLRNFFQCKCRSFHAQ